MLYPPRGLLMYLISNEANPCVLMGDNIQHVLLSEKSEQVEHAGYGTICVKTQNVLL